MSLLGFYKTLNWDFLLEIALSSFPECWLAECFSDFSYSRMHVDDGHSAEGQSVIPSTRIPSHVKAFIYHDLFVSRTSDHCHSRKSP